MTIAAISYPKNNWGISKMEKFLTLDIVSIGDTSSRCVYFPGNCNSYDKLETGLSGVQFCL